MDASYKIQRGIHVHLIQFFMCPEFWVHITNRKMCYAFIYNKETRPNMGRTSTKENKNSYQLAREELGLTREKASELLV